MAKVDPSVYYLLLQLAGRTNVVHAGNEVVLNPGDLTLADAAEPSRMIFEGVNEQLCLHIPKRWISDLGVSGGLRVGTVERGGLAMVLGSLLRPAFGDPICFTESAGGAIRESVLRMVVATWEGEQSGAPQDEAETAVDAPLLRQMQSYILGSLTCQTLTPQSVADTFGISVRCLHRLFQEAGTSMGEWIRKMRLERCASDLRDPSLTSQSITQIAFRWGFNEAAHFSRSFKAELGCSPREYRAVAPRTYAS